MVETRVYITTDLSKRNVNNDEFINHCEMEGGVYSLQGFQDAWNNDNLGNNIPDITIIRILDIDIPNEEERKIGMDFKMPSNVKDSNNGCVEYCPECECEVLLETKFDVQICPNCGMKILPCNQCVEHNCSNCPLNK